MSDEEEIDLEFQEADLNGLNVITIRYDESGEPPEVDLGDASPWLAATIFERAIELLTQGFPLPRIFRNGSLLIDPYHECGPECLEDDED